MSGGGPDAGGSPAGPEDGNAVTVAETPLAPTEITDLLAPLARYGTVLLAVSGGADSMAMMLAVARWRDTLGGVAPDIEVVTVDHRLRAESAAETRFVAAAAATLGLRHRIVTWNDPPDGGGSGLQAAARDARYQLLGEVAAACERRPVAIVTAHTADDQAETVAMRLMRGSGLDGLAGIPPRRPLVPGSDVDVVRPLLAVGRARLVATLQAAGQAHTDDPSNRDLAFERVRVRAALTALAAHGIAAPALARSAARLRRARDALAATTDTFMAEAVTMANGVYAGIERARLDDAPEDIRVRVLGRLVRGFGGLAEPPRLDQVEALVERMAHATFRGETLGGAMVRARGAEIVVFRETGRERLEELLLEPGGAALWDGRFRVALGRVAAAKLTVGALGAAGVHEIRAEQPLPAGPPLRALEGVPAFRDVAGAILAVPQLGFVRPGGAAATAVPAADRR
jgi:tRNA(Ile)-lysidine synthase